MTTDTTEISGEQRHTLADLQRWEQLGYGMFIHFGMSTFDDVELSKGDKPSSFYAPSKVDVDQWISVARDAGMKYAVLTAKHVAGHCLWPTKHTDYSVATSGNKTDVVEAFFIACEKHGVLPALYYCTWDNHHTFGSVTPTYARWSSAFTTVEYREFQMRQVEELLGQYGRICEMWIDIPGLLGHEGRRQQYEQIARLQPQAMVMMNNAFGDGTQLHVDAVWPTDLMAIERGLPSSANGYNPWHAFNQRGLHTATQVGKLEFKQDPPRQYYIPAEVCDPIGRHWFASDKDVLRSDGELLGMRLICQARRANLLLNVPPSKRGVIEDKYVGALRRLRKNLEKAL